MALIISPNFDRISLTAGEPISIMFQPCSAAGVPERDIAINKWPLCVLDDNGEKNDFFAIHGLDENGAPALFWRITGFITRTWLNRPNLRFYLNKVRNDGHEEVTAGPIALRAGAPTLYDDDSVPFSTYITKVRRLNDPLDTLNAPRFTRETVLLSEEPPVTPPDEEPLTASPFDLGSANNILAFAAF